MAVLFWLSLFFVFVEGIDGSRVLELSDRFLDFKDEHKGPWMIKFYAPWCPHCKTLEPIWAQVAQTLFGTNVNVGRIDCTRFTSIATHYSVSGFPTILYIEKGVVVTYKGDRTREDIVDFTYKMMGPAVRDVGNIDKMEEVRRNHELFFLLISSNPGSEIEVAYELAANQFRHYNYFYKICHSFADEALRLDIPAAPAIMIFKDSIYFSYSRDSSTENYNSSVVEWVSKERFPMIIKITHGNIHEISLVKKYIVIAVVEEDIVRKLNATHLSYKRKFESFCLKSYERYKDDFAFGWIGNLELASSLTMMHVPIPNVIVLNSTSQHYHMIGDVVQKPHQVTAKELEVFLNHVQEGSIPTYGGTGIGSRIYRMYFNVVTSLILIWNNSPILAIILFGFPSIFFIMIIYTTYFSSMWVLSEDEEEDHEKAE